MVYKCDLTHSWCSFCFGLQHNIFIENIGYAVAIETIQILRCVWKILHTHTDTRVCTPQGGVSNAAAVCITIITSGVFQHK